MLNKEKHQLMMGRILNDLSMDTSIAPLLGFKGDTCAYLFYGLTRFSVDLDFDLLAPDTMPDEELLERIKKIASRYGIIKDSYVKNFTVFVLLSYGDTDHNIKIEINRRIVDQGEKGKYVSYDYLGMPLLVASKQYMLSCKLAALTGRKNTAMRDIFDIHYFLAAGWEIDEAALRLRTNKETKDYLLECADFIEKIPDNRLLEKLGELIDEEQKQWIKTKLKKEVTFLLKNYSAALIKAKH